MEIIQKKIITPALICRYESHLQEQEKSAATIEKYVRNLNAAADFQGAELDRPLLIAWKEQLSARYAVSSVNGILAAVNGLFAFCDWGELKVKPLKKQRELFCAENRELTRDEYIRLVQAAKENGNERLSLVLQTICGTGIRVSELRCITAEAVRMGRAEVNGKGKRRTVFLPQKLCQLLSKYLKRQRRTTGPVFVTKNGRPLNRSNIWRDMKALCDSANVEPGKVFPHNLRHLFARTYYAMEKDLSRLADLLGHSNVNTTRIYTVESGAVHARQVERMGLVIT